MLESASIMAFLATTDPARARPFFQETLGLRFIADEPYALVFDANGTMLRVAKAQTFTPAPYTVLGWKVPDIRAAIGALTGKGVKFERFDGLDQDDLGICTFPGGAQVAWFKDPDGNVLSLTQFG